MVYIGHYAFMHLIQIRSQKLHIVLFIIYQSVAYVLVRMMIVKLWAVTAHLKALYS